jgi:hypothetical protein
MTAILAGYLSFPDATVPTAGIRDWRLIGHSIACFSAVDAPRRIVLCPISHASRLSRISSRPIDLAANTVNLLSVSWPALDYIVPIT